jgi:murein DD-endopeptidase MepM/ murein hydrolase activator NlpD
MRPGQAGAIALKVSTRARYLRPGEVVLLTAVPSRPLAVLRGEAFGRGVGFWQAGNGDSWQGLAGIPLDSEPGSQRIHLHGTGRDGGPAMASVPLQIVPARFRTRRLRVDDRFLNPPEEMAGRIRREAETLRELFDRVRPGRLWDGPFSKPVPGPVTSTFGRLTILNGTPQGRHQGSDLRAETGTPVRAPQSGEIVLADDLYYSGNTVIVDHGEGLYSLVAHLSRIVVEEGDRVERGALVGESGATGRVTAPHLHWAVRLQGVPVDPLSLAAAVGKRTQERTGRITRPVIPLPAK